jgi:hypothetical protein
MKKRFLLTALFLIANIGLLFAQGELPCGDGDPDGVTCPIDSWVVVLVIGTLIFAVLQLHNKQKTTAPLL